MPPHRGGACHNQSDYFLVDIGQAETSLGLEYLDPQAGAEKAENVVNHQDWRTVFNSLVMCLYSNVGPSKVVDLINTACGFEWTIDDMMRCGDRGWNLKRVINNRLGLTRQNDRLPKSLLVPYVDDKDGSDRFVPDLDAMLSAYYRLRDWDAKTGCPTQEKLMTLGLDWVRAQ